ncbi:MAG: hypothetical protein LBB56_02660, partial [Chitinispirillales bacterium]|nr:hypothetical protein [Chitinispirillales bacterium]
MSKRFFYFFVSIVFLCNFCVYAQNKPFKSKNSLLKSASSKSLVKTAANYQWSINFPKSNNEKDTLQIIAIRVEFKQNNESALTTGNGLFGIRGNPSSKDEQKYYLNNTYKFDNLPHDYFYFENQLKALRNYYAKVSRQKLELEYSIYPKNRSQSLETGSGYSVDNNMTYYSPGWKKKEEKSDEYWDRKTHGLMTFVKDAVNAAANSVEDSPFANLKQDGDGVLRDVTTNRKAVILIFHAGASYLTDGGLEGGAGANTPSDMIDAFIDRDFFKYFKDTLGLNETGISVKGSGGQTIVIDE